ncbi:MAG: Stage sporulation protein (SpoVAC) [Oscillospiraceae bacterium]|nr:Stage sporulation protein (SpoVAC) [Oscillospiraceae bacterium]
MKDMSNQEYSRYVESKAKPSPIGKNCLLAFLVGGAICTLGQALSQVYQMWGLPKDEAGTAVSMTLIFLAALFTGLGLFDNLAKYAGAGTLVPITGFANAMAAPALEFKSEGLITGTGAKLFTVAGPVLVYGIGTSIVYGIFFFIWKSIAS